MISILYDQWIDHLEDTTYTSHYIDAMNYSSRAFAASIALLLHGFFPCVFPDWGAETIKQLNDEMHCVDIVDPNDYIPGSLAQSIHE